MINRTFVFLCGDVPQINVLNRFRRDGTSIAVRCHHGRHLHISKTSLSSRIGMYLSSTHSEPVGVLQLRSAEPTRRFVNDGSVSSCCFSMH